VEYRDFCGGRVSALGFGTMRLPKRDDGSIDREKAASMVESAFAGGVNYFDTAWCYHDGDSEVFLGEALAAHPRESYFLTDKLPVWVCGSREDDVRIFDEQLRRCRVEYFDYYLAHSIDADNYKSMVKCEAYPFLCEKKREGRIKKLGFSFHGDAALMETMLRDYEWDFVQLELNYLDWSEQDAEKIYGMVREKGLPVVVMEPLRGGMLVSPPAVAAAALKNADPELPFPDWAFRWLFGLEGVSVILSGMSSPEQLSDNLRIFSACEPLDPAHRAALEKVVAAIRSVERVPCTACGYCMPCPAGVDIPGMLKIYNTFLESRYTMELKASYDRAPKASRAENCTSCGACRAVCPQGIAAFEHMKELTKVIEDIK